MNAFIWPASTMENVTMSVLQSNDGCQALTTYSLVIVQQKKERALHPSSHHIHWHMLSPSCTLACPWALKNTMTVV